MKRILVTGDKGYIGSALVPFLLKKGYSVTGLDAAYFTENIDLKPSSQYRSIQKDIRNVSEKDLEGVDAVIHLSALSNDPMGELNTSLTEDINYKTSMKLAKISKSLGVRRFIFSSSCSVYGIAKTDIVAETSEVNPLTAYARSKLMVEEGLKEMSGKDFCVGIMRNATVYGYAPKFRNDLVVNNLVTSAVALNQIRVLSDGTPWRPLIDVRDISRAFIAFLEASEEKINGEVVNVGFTNSNYRIKDIVDVIKKELPECEVVYTGEHGADTRSYRVSFEKFHKLFPSLFQEWPLEKSIKDLIKKLKRISYSKEDFNSGKHTRLSVLKNLIESGKIDDNLYYT